MKKIFYVLLCMGMLVGCGKSQEEELKELKALDIPKISKSEASASFLEKYPDPNEIVKYSDKFADSCNISKESSYNIVELSSKDGQYTIKYEYKTSYNLHNEQYLDWYTTIYFNDYLDSAGDSYLLEYGPHLQNNYEIIGNGCYADLQTEWFSCVEEKTIEDRIKILKVKVYYNDFLEEYNGLNIEKIDKKVLSILAEGKIE